MSDWTSIVSQVAASGVSFMNTIKTNPEDMRAKASDTSARISEMKAAFEALGAAVDRTSGYWVGEAGDAHRSFFNEKRDNMDEIIRRLTEDVNDLEQMASGYDAAELANQSIAEDLAGDVIV